MYHDTTIPAFTAEELAAELIAMRAGQPMTARMASIVGRLAGSVWRRLSRPCDCGGRDDFIQECVLRTYSATPTIDTADPDRCVRYLYTVYTRVLAVARQRAAREAELVTRYALECQT